MIGDPKCPECHSPAVAQSAVPGLAECKNCGQVFALSEELIKMLFEPEEETISDEPIIEIPDQLDSDIGWRTWALPKETPRSGIPKLYSATQKEVFWTPGQAMVAICPQNVRRRANGVVGKDHEVPKPSCTCGLYAAKTYEHLLTMDYHWHNAEKQGMWAVVGKVLLGGTVIEGTQGWRASYGYPSELYLPYEAWKMIEPLEETYECEVMLDNFLGPAITKKKEQ